MDDIHLKKKKKESDTSMSKKGTGGMRSRVICQSETARTRQIIIKAEYNEFTEITTG